MSRNIPLFIGFRMLFSARFYYPVFAVIQLDYGLTMEQFALLNATWAISILCFEVPSGALADRFGRKRMVVASAVLMLIALLLIAVLPLGNGSLVFWVWMLNRILSGAAAAAASGADEALVYDSLSETDRESQWTTVLARHMRFSALAFIVAMLVGAAVYDPALVNRALAGLGLSFEVTKDQTLRFPIYLTLLATLLATGLALLMHEPSRTTKRKPNSSLWSDTWQAAAWILKTPVVLALLSAAMIHDSLVRLFLTMNSEYYRLIGLPDATFGIIGASFAALGLLTPSLARCMVRRGGVPGNYLVVSVLVFAGLLGVAQAWPIYGVLTAAVLGVALGLLNFFTSHYLNAQVDSAHRATVLSFKGLVLNLGFGLLSLLYASLLRSLRAGRTELADAELTTVVFAESLRWLPGTFLVLLVPLILYYLFAVKLRAGSTTS